MGSLFILSLVQDVIFFFSDVASVFFSPFFVCIFSVVFVLLFLKHSVFNLLKTLVLVEVVLLGLSLGFVVLSTFLSTVLGNVFALFILALAGCESALGLSLLILFFRNRGMSATFEKLSTLKG
jgi:NADH-quinone oxidoreductase subunit K